MSRDRSGSITPKARADSQSSFDELIAEVDSLVADVAIYAQTHEPIEAHQIPAFKSSSSFDRAAHLRNLARRATVPLLPWDRRDALVFPDYDPTTDFVIVLLSSYREPQILPASRERQDYSIEYRDGLTKKLYSAQQVAWVAEYSHKGLKECENFVAGYDPTKQVSKH